MVINGKNNTKANRHYKIVASRCVGDCLTAITTVETEDRKRYWSKPIDWPSGKVPAEGEDVEIESGWDMIFDLEDSPVYK